MTLDQIRAERVRFSAARAAEGVPVIWDEWVDRAGSVREAEPRGSSAREAWAAWLERAALEARGQR